MEIPFEKFHENYFHFMRVLFFQTEMFETTKTFEI